MTAGTRQLAKNEFPALLQEIPDPPETLFLHGEMLRDELRYLCVVGSRKYSQYGKSVCETLIAGLRGYPVVIVSGLALGIDSIAHRAALDAGLTTIAVPGSGLGWDVLYPASHRALARRIIERGGTLLSEFPNDFEATPYSFPQRNRIMAGLSHAVLVIEATERSGTLITARLATEYNRDVCTVPHSIFSASSYGPHQLIRNGATPVTSSEDLLEVLDVEITEQKGPDVRELSGEERLIVSLLSVPLSRDELIEQLDMSTAQANVLLSAMELKGVIKEQLGEMRLS
jgi:DNA processing protein